MTTDMALIETFLQSSANDLGLAIEFNIDSNKIDIRHNDLDLSKEKYLAFDRRVVQIANSATHANDYKNYLNVGNPDFNPSLHIDLNETSIETMNNKIRNIVATELSEEIFIEHLES